MIRLKSILSAVIFLLINFQLLSASEYIKVYFNDPSNTSDPTLSEFSSDNLGIDDALIAFIDSAAAGDTLYAAFYDLDRTKIATAFNSAIARGVTVFFVSDNVEGNTAAYASLTTSSKTLDSTANLMHNKFCVLKDSAVWTGSYNATDNGTANNSNNAVLIYSSNLAQIYENEFLEMYAGRFSTNKTLAANTGKTVTLADGTKIDVYFAPYTSISVTTSEAIQSYISNASYSVLFNIFKFTAAETGIVGKLKTAYNRGLEIKGVFDTGSIYDFGSHTSAYASLKEYGLDVITSGIESKLHHKFCVFDYGSSNAKVLTGSYNWTSSSNNSNDENFIVIHSTSVAKAYWGEIQKNYKLGSSILTENDQKAVTEIIIYPSPAKDTDAVTIGFTLGATVEEIKLIIYSLAGEEVNNYEPDFYPGTYNEVNVILENTSGSKLASGLYIVKIEAKNADGTFYDMNKFTVIR